MHHTTVRISVNTALPQCSHNTWHRVGSHSGISVSGLICHATRYGDDSRTVDDVSRQTAGATQYLSEAFSLRHLCAV